MSVNTFDDNYDLYAQNVLDAPVKTNWLISGHITFDQSERSSDKGR